MSKQPRIALYFHCKNCLSGRLACGWTNEGVQVYCENCELSVIDIDFGGMKVKHYVPPKVSGSKTVGSTKKEKL